MSRARVRAAADDERFMRRALDEARRGVGHTSPNPAVGAVVVRGGRIIAIGYHREAGEDHAEVDALRKAGAKAKGATLYATLEPCVHFGRTPPCTRAILDAGIKRVVVGSRDPNPRVSGRGIVELEKAGLEVAIGVLEEECRALNEAFNHAITRRSPFVVLKAAVSLDGRTATRSGDSKWITGPAARRAGRALRAELDCIVIGIETALADDPSLTARATGAKNPLRVVLDSKLRLPPSSKLAKTAARVPTLVVTTLAASARRRRALEALGVDVQILPSDKSGRVRIGKVLELLYKRGHNGVLVEGGQTIHGAFLDAKAVHRVVLFVAPKLIGGEAAPGAFGGTGVSSLADALELDRLEAVPVGRDLMLTGRVRTRRS